MNDEQLSALLAAIGERGTVEADGFAIECDGLRVGRDGDGYRFETPGATHAGMSEREFREVCAANPWFVSNWYYWEEIDRPAAHRAFLRWVERAPATTGNRPEGAGAVPDAERAVPDEADAERAVPDEAERLTAGGANAFGVRERYEALAEGVDRTWGQVLIGAELGTDGRRIYHTRHVDDADRERSTLSVHIDPLAARHIVKTDDRGRYRPLKTAPTMPTGWAFADLEGHELVRFVDVVYPATVANWHRERRGELDVSHYRETAERQTGIYDIVEDLPAEAVEWVAEACCVDSQCLKRRRWDEDADTPLAVPRGDGEFPCREPCSLVVAAAREWTLLERERPRTYEFELTPGEREQVEAIVDAVADGRAHEIREADFAEGANRWRARYLRAKRMDEAGRLGADATADED